MLRTSHYSFGNHYQWSTTNNVYQKIREEKNQVHCKLSASAPKLNKFFCGLGSILYQVLCKSAKCFLSNPADKETNKEANQQTGSSENLMSLVEVIN